MLLVRCPRTYQVVTFCLAELNAELVALWISHGDPAAPVGSTMISDDSPAHLQDSIDLLVASAIHWLYVEMDPILYRLRLGNPDEEKCRTLPDLHQCFRIARLVLVTDGRIQDVCPKRSLLIGIGTVERDVSNS
jgi:hypothetical protein